MRIAVLSDIHDNIWNLEKIIPDIKLNAEVVIFCGDMVAPFTAAMLATTGLETYACLGNNDEDHIGLFKQAGKQFHWTNLSQEFGEVELGGKKIAFCHYPKLGELLAETGHYDLVGFGHTHEVRNEAKGNCLLLNPGAVCGIQKGRPGSAHYAVYDTEIHTAKIVEIV